MSISAEIRHVRTDLGLRPGGVARGGQVLLAAGLADRVGAAVSDPLLAPRFDKALDPVWKVPNLTAAAELAIQQADWVQQVLGRGGFPLVLGGDDSVLFGCLLGLRRTGNAGLMLLDGHTDFWDPRDGAGELSDSDLFIATGRGPGILADLEGLRPLVSDEHCVIYGHRDRADQLERGSQDVYRTTMLVRNLDELRAAGMTDAGHHAVARLRHLGVGRVWVHLDADCLDDAIMPAVDWRVPGGLTPDEVRALLAPLLASGLAAGLDVTIYNPDLDSPSFTAASVLVDLLADLLADDRRADKAASRIGTDSEPLTPRQGTGGFAASHEGSA